MGSFSRGLVAFLAVVLLVACSGGGSTVTKEDGRLGEEDLQGAHDLGLDTRETEPDRFVHDAFVLDLSTDSAPDVFVPCAPGEGCFMDPCTENSQCLSGWCVEHMGEGVCTQQCQEECPPGWGCKSVSSGPDLVYVCVSAFSNLCKPCTTSEGCKSVAGAEDVCLDYGSEGSFCGGGCVSDGDCPWGFSCVDGSSVEGVSLKQCMADSGVCPCADKSVLLGLSTPCQVSNEWGTCMGKRVCAQGGLTACDAALPGLEVCNGVDDNCDGDVDEASFVEGKYVDLCDDEDDCTADACKGEEGCEHAALTGDECKDGNPCTVADLCKDGVCVGSPVECDDDNPCTDDACNDTGGCVFTANTAKCDDGDPCTVGDECTDTECAGYAVDCACQHSSDCGALEDGDFCNGTLYCNTESFPYQCDVVEGSVVECPPPVGVDAPCLAPSCDPASGACSLVAANDGALCDDLDACTIGDLCLNGQCQPGKAANCNDGNLCTDDSCDPESGCLHTNNTAPCNDANTCTLNDLCGDGQCQPGGQLLDCDDGNICTDDACEAGVGCVHAKNQSPCDDGNACTTGDSCTAGGCQAGSGLLDCNDNNPCTTDSCDAEIGCTYASNTIPCDDGDPCTLNDHCKDGLCGAGAAPNCDDGNPCTDDACIGDGTCQHIPNLGDCDDGNACTLGDHCSEGECVYNALFQCNDNDVCTDDSCDPLQGCLHLLNNAPCDDGDLCTTADACSLGECVGGVAVVCNDSNLCTDDSCLPESGCQYLPNQGPCDDGNACTEGDHCVAGQCKGGKQIDCDDLNGCTNDACDVDQGCLYTFNTAPCDDGDICTFGEVCDLGQCTSGKPLNCNDGDICTDDTCLPESGCVHTLNNAPCSDGNACTENDACVDGACAPGGKVDCDDANVCTADACDPVDGCVYAHADGSCEDGNACSENDICVDSQCVAGDDVVCNDGNVCTDDSCDPESGCLFVPNQADCNDDDACTDGDTCQGGACVAGPALDCDDTNACTSDSCLPASGCDHQPVANYTDCGDGNVCYQGECTNCPDPSGSKTFSYTGGSQTWVVPDCVFEVTIEVWGAQGGGSNGGEDGGLGGYSKGVLTVTPGETLSVYVGGKGQNQSSGGWNGGGHGSTYGGGGGGGTDVRQGGTALTDRKIVAGGGAGGQTGGPDHGAGGYGGGTTGQTGISYQGWTPGGGGTQNSGGSAGSQCSAGTFGSGGSKASYHVSGGGGGWYGGGCAYAAGGGGGSGYVGGVANGTTTGNSRSGHGQAKFVW